MIMPLSAWVRVHNFFMALSAWTSRFWHRTLTASWVAALLAQGGWTVAACMSAPHSVRLDREPPPWPWVHDHAVRWDLRCKHWAVRWQPRWTISQQNLVWLIIIIHNRPASPTAHADCSPPNSVHGHDIVFVATNCSGPPYVHSHDNARLVIIHDIKTTLSL